MRPVGGGAYVIDGDLSPKAALEQAEAALRAAGMDDWDIHEFNLSVRRAWWGGDELGFVGKDHPQAQPVVVVHLPDGVLP